MLSRGPGSDAEGVAGVRRVHVGDHDQRVDAATDQDLKDILAHNRDEEKEHFAMLLEWYRRRDAKMDAHLKEYLFTTGSLIAREQASSGGGGGSADASPAAEARWASAA